MRSLWTPTGRWFLLAAVLTGVLLGLSACGGSRSKDVVSTMAGGRPEHHSGAPAVAGSLVGVRRVVPGSAHAHAHRQGVAAGQGRQPGADLGSRHQDRRRHRRRHARQRPRRRPRPEVRRRGLGRPEADRRLGRLRQRQGRARRLQLRAGRVRHDDHRLARYGDDRLDLDGEAARQLGDADRAAGIRRARRPRALRSRS